MIAVIVSACMWLLVACLLVLRRGRVERSITYASFTIAVSITLNIDAVYLALDGWLGGTNLVTLAADLALMTGVFFLGRGVMKAADAPSRAVRIALGRLAFTIAVVSATVAFVLIDRRATTPEFMLDLGGQPATAAYSMILFTYYAVVLVAMGAVATRQVRVSHGIDALPPVLLVIGCACGVALSAVVAVMDIAHISGNLDVMTGAAVAYGPLYLLTFVFLCLGFAGQPAVRTIRARERARTTLSLTAQLAPVWQAASEVRPGISQDAAFDDADPEALLHRQVVEIRDALIDGRVTFTISVAQRELLEEAERHLVGGAGNSTPMRVRT
ncbi:hypothetical protein GE115_02705 [Agromyces sp. CFH 90414]|uniref:Histidine kinase N-terminal 7TM region domain-containing protein n=1 Tax=Agromyces agglutinans TaxID=2662258 RepID=A0A6I2F4X9_9MICO|nr:DUF6545 domain-containing protein [Agromyces agglutinans]MRG58787.1 hypothetical protein [Agromyces agglutinans]